MRYAGINMQVPATDYVVGGTILTFGILDTRTIRVCPHDVTWHNAHTTYYM